MTEFHTSPNVRFLTSLKKITDIGLTARDVLILYAVISRPGQNGNDITKIIGAKTRSTIVDGFNRLIKKGFMEDHRVRESRAVPTIFYATDAGKAFWDSIKP